jgi:O-antigen/teichoic acid export membrane protein
VERLARRRLARHAIGHREYPLSVSRHTGYNLIGLVVPIAISLVTVPIYLRLVGTDRYGVLAIAWLLLGYFGLFDLGLGRATSFRIASLKSASPEARASTFWAAFAVNVAMGGVGGLALWAAASQFFGHVFKVDEALRPEILAAVPLLAASVPVATITGVLTGAVQGRERFLEINIVSVVSTALFQLLPLAIAWKFGPNLVWLLTAALAARFLGALVLAYRCYLELTRGQPIRTDRKEMGVLLRYGGWVNLASIFAPVLVMLDRFVIGATIGAAAVTTYSVPNQLASRTAIMSYALNNALFPRLSAASPEERQVLSERAILAFAALLGVPFLGAIYLIGPFLHVWVHERLGPEAPIVGRLLVAATWTNGLALISYTRLQASGRPDVVTWVTLLEIPPYVGLLYLGLHFWGLPGAALATSIRFAADFVILTVLAGAPTRAWRAVAATSALLIAGVWFASLWGIGDWRWWASAIVLGCALLALGLRTLPVDVRGQIRSLLQGYAARLLPGRRA